MKRKQQENENIIAVSMEARAYPLVSLGDGRPSGGTKEHHKHRFEILDRIRSVSYLTPPQQNTWGAFKEMWDDNRRQALGVALGRVFAEETKQILTDLHNGSLNALSQWMENERQRVLPNVECLLLPGVDFM